MLGSHTTQGSPLKLLALCGIAAPIIFAILVTVGGLIYEGYSHSAQAVSELGGVEAQYPLLQSTNFLVVGVLFIPFAFGLRRGLGNGRRSTLGPVLVGIFGVSSGIGNAVFPCDPGCEFQTVTGTLHNLTGLGGFIAAVAGIFVISRKLKGDPRWHFLYRFSWITGVLVMLSLFLWIGVAKVAEIGSLNGVLQLVFIGAWFIWVEVMAFRLLFLSRRNLSTDTNGE